MTKDSFFNAMEEQGLALTFDDVRVKTRHCDFDFHAVDLRSRFSKNVPLKIPIVSAAMDTVTERKMAIALASLGGLGIIHRNLDPETQSKHVRAAKFYLNGRIDTPVTMQQTNKVEEVLRICDERNYAFRSFPITDSDGKLVGILTGNDIKFCKDKSASVVEAMTRQVVKGNSATTLHEAHALMLQNKIGVLPLVSDDGSVTGLYLWSDLERILSGNTSHNTDDNGQLRVGAAIGTGDDTRERVELLLHRGVDVIVIDAAHSDSRQVIGTFEWVKQLAGDKVDVVVGNISEYDSAARLAEMDVDGIKVGQGGGSICTTRRVAGIGTPQVTAIFGCAKAVRDSGKDIPVCGDGGIREPGDITIAIAAGADSVMLGGMLAGTDEAPGDVIDTPRGQRKQYRGMGSLSAMEASASSRNRYGETQRDKSKILPEGVESYVPYAGPLETVIHRYVEGLRRGMGYSGAKSIAALQQETEFWRVTNAGVIESHPHDVETINR